jgi:hypothetical protein
MFRISTNRLMAVILVLVLSPFHFTQVFGHLEDGKNI